MILTQRLIGYLHRVFDKDPKKFLALRLRYPGGTMAWDVTDGVLTTIVGGGSGQNLTVPLDSYTVSTLANFLGTQTGYVVEYVDSSDLAQLSAQVLIDGKGDQAASNGDHLYGYTSLLWVYMEGVARELRAARQAISDMLAQLHIPTAEGEWIDEWGSYFAVERITGELDASYRNRVIVDPMQVRSTNRALEDLIQRGAGIAVDVVDIDWRPGSSNLQQLGLITTAPGEWPTGGYPYWGNPANNLPIVCTFGVIIYFNVNDIDPVTLAKIKNVVERYRASGTNVLYFGQQNLLHTNTLGETANNLGYICGPRASQFVPIMI